MKIIDSLFEHNIYDGIDEDHHFNSPKVEGKILLFY